VGNDTGWIFYLSLYLLMAVIAAVALLRPGSSQANLLVIGLVTLLLSVFNAMNDILVDAYRTDLLRDDERGPSATVVSFGCRAAMLTIGVGGFLGAGLGAGRYAWPVVFLASAAFIASTISKTVKGNWLRGVLP
jgi:MFS transporter, PAT family, beta-lactamase induction signal transducer AmpG